ncbi:MAG: AAA family ATPase [Planctomycetaceae bacterium]
MSERSPFLNRVRIRNYKSITECDVKLGRLTLLVGRNGAGKSNFLDALRFVAESLETSVDHAIKSRGGVAAVRRISTGHPRNFRIELEVHLASECAEFEFEIGSQPKGGFIVKAERLRISTYSGALRHEYTIEDGAIVHSTAETLPVPASDRLFLVVASGLREFRPVYDSLLSMGFYNLNPDQIKEVQKPDAGELLRRDGSNLASVVARLAEDRPQVKARIQEYLQQIVPEIVDFQRVPVGHHETLEFRQKVTGSEHPWRFYAGSMSDGTLRTLGILVAAMQLAERTDPISLVGIEEPETALHPAASGALMDALREAAATTQVVATTHSPDLLDRFDPDSDTLLSVVSSEGTTRIGPTDDASLEAIRDHLYTAGELLRMDQLRPQDQQLELFEETTA